MTTTFGPAAPRDIAGRARRPQAASRHAASERRSMAVTPGPASSPPRRGPVHSARRRPRSNRKHPPSARATGGAPPDLLGEAEAVRELLHAAAARLGRLVAALK